MGLDINKIFELKGVPEEQELGHPKKITLREAFDQNGTREERDIRWAEYKRQQSEIFTEARMALSRGESFVNKTDLPYVRIFFNIDSSENNRNIIRFPDFARLINDKLNGPAGGSSYLNNPKFGEYEVVSGGFGKTSKGTELLYIDFFPLERFEFQAEGEEKLSKEEICDAVIHDKRLMAQFDYCNVAEVQTSTGLRVNMEIGRPVVRTAPPVQPTVTQGTEHKLGMGS